MPGRKGDVDVTVNGLPVTGMVGSVMEDQSSIPMRWIVSVVPESRTAAQTDFTLRELNWGGRPLPIVALN